MGYGCDADHRRADAAPLRDGVGVGQPASCEAARRAGAASLRFAAVLSTHPAQFQAATFKGELDANLRHIADMGYDGVELAIRDPRLIDVEAVGRSLDAAGLVVPAIGTGQAWAEEGLSFVNANAAVRQAAIDRVCSHVPLAARWGAVIIIGLIRGTVFPGVGHEQAMAWLVEALQQCAAVAANEGVRLALEPINRYETALVNSVAQGLELVQAVGSPNFGLLLDTYHMNIEEPRIEASIQAACEHIVHFHVADSNRCYPGAGHLDFAGILAALRATGYRGFATAEILPEPDAVTAAARGIAYLRSLI